MSVPSIPPEALVDLMRALVLLCPNVCDSSHFAVLLGAYGASLSTLGACRGGAPVGDGEPVR